jgi:prepilin peptidase CpaA
LLPVACAAIAMVTVYLWVCGALLLSLAGMDLRRRRLPNRLVAGVLLSYLLYAAVAPAHLPLHLGVGLAALLVGMLLTAGGVIGAGDAKLAAAIFCWAGPEASLPTLLLITQTGLLLALLGLAARFGLRHGVSGPPARLLHCLTVDRGVPYGVALAAGGMFVLLTLI